jgi:hypothetical protein
MLSMEKILKNMQSTNEYAKQLLEEVEVQVREQRLKIDQEQTILHDLMRRRSVLKDAICVNNQILGIADDND